MTRQLLNIIVAVSSEGGIGLCGGLPWRLKKDMAFFTRITTESKPGLKNAVIMGRLTWQSIPEKFRPLSNRINVIVSTTMSEAPHDTYLVSSLPEAFKLLYGPLHTQLDNIFVIGGRQLYQEALNQCEYPVRIYCTHVTGDVKCDTFFPPVEWEKLRVVKLPNVPSEIIEENGLSYRFVVYELDNGRSPDCPSSPH